MLEHHTQCPSVRQFVTTPSDALPVRVVRVTGNEVGIFPPFVGATEHLEPGDHNAPNGRQRAGPATLHSLLGL